MLVQDTVSALLRAIPKAEIQPQVRKLVFDFLGDVVGMLEGFADNGVDPQTTFDLEVQLAARLRSLGCAILAWFFPLLEPADVEELPGAVVYENQRYRRLREKTKRERIVTRFGNISLTRARYRRGRSGKVLAPLEKALGIIQGFTPAAADWAGRQLAAPGASQQRVVDALDENFGCKIGQEKLRRLSSGLAESMERHREDCQREQLLTWIKGVRKNGKTPVLSVSRDGVSLGIQPFGFFEMAGVATLSVLSEGERVGTVYLACTPEENQQTLSENLTSLLTTTLQACGKQLPKVVYVTDAGKIETAYWKATLRHLRVDGHRIKVIRVVDYFHASQRLATIAEALHISPAERTSWNEKVRQMLKEPGGWGRVMRSITKMKGLHGYLKSKAEDAQKAVRYLRRYRRYMNYSELKAAELPCGSGIVESACKQIVSERMKLSGMRWKRAGAQSIMTLRSILLSKTWNATFSRILKAISLPVGELTN
jgi:hypothetical protein